ncbi:hypothetical protein ACX0HA_12020 [Flavobacterium hauense]
MEKNYDQHKVSQQETESKKESISIEAINKDSIMTALKRLLGQDKEHDIHGLSEFAWP